MRSLQLIRAEIRALQEEERATIKAMKAEVIASMMSNIKELGISPEELGFRIEKTGRGAIDKEVTEVPLQKAKIKTDVKYRNAEGKTWSGGRGRKPDWVKKIERDNGNIEDYRIDQGLDSLSV